ncbi:hypothetical protein EV182_000511 [Spiromyces aspiralis]|uniref:Uncharacterized protein n=1 Tax=Spiromyces aspiralis TaxID=68401 RepID=A0ACC1HKN6_9FUNG|nr:hypothetical protein EV182_000511 [Spiromyces aspiralis]
MSILKKLLPHCFHNTAASNSGGSSNSSNHGRRSNSYSSNHDNHNSIGYPSSQTAGNPNPTESITNVVDNNLAMAKAQAEQPPTYASVAKSTQRYNRIPTKLNVHHQTESTASVDTIVGETAVTTDSKDTAKLGINPGDYIPGATVSTHPVGLEIENPPCKLTQERAHAQTRARRRYPDCPLVSRKVVTSGLARRRLQQWQGGRKQVPGLEITHSNSSETTLAGGMEGEAGGTTSALTTPAIAV